MKNPHSVSRFAAVLAGLIAFSAAARAQGLTAEQLTRIKAASVYITVMTKEGGGSGSGFVVKVDGDNIYIVSNDHVIDPDHKIIAAGGEPPAGRPKPVIMVYFDSGTPKERSARATVLAADFERDLAVIKVTKVKDPPKPLDLTDPPPLMETMPLYVCGFPFGARLAEGDKNPEITINRGSVSAIRKDPLGRITTVQIDGALNPGNSGGPVVSADGKIIGVAVRSILGAGIGEAVPQHEVTRMLAGRPGRVKVVPKMPEATEDGPAELTVKLIDPLKKVKSVAAYYRKSLPSMKADGDKPEIMPGAERVVLTIADGVAKGEITAATKGRMHVQFEMELADGQLISTPVEVTITGSGPTPNPNMLESPQSGRARARTPDGRIVELPAMPLREKPKGSATATNLSDLSIRPTDYIDKDITLEGLSSLQLSQLPDGNYEITLLTEAGNVPNNLSMILPKDIALQLSEVYLIDGFGYSYALRLDGKVRKPKGRSEVHPFEVSELHFINEESKPVTTLKSLAAAPPGPPTLSTVNRFPADFKGKSITLEAFVTGVDNASREIALKVNHESCTPVLNLKFFASKQLAAQVENDVPGNGTLAKLECVVEDVDARKGFGIVGVKSIEILDADRKSKKKLTSSDKITFPVSTPLPKAAAPGEKTNASTAAKAEPEANVRRGAAEPKPEGSNLLLFVGIGGGLGFVALAVGAFLLLKGGKKGEAVKKVKSKPASKYARKTEPEAQEDLAETPTPRPVAKPVAKPVPAPEAATPVPVARAKPKPKNDDNPFANFG